MPKASERATAASARRPTPAPRARSAGERATAAPDAAGVRDSSADDRVRCPWAVGEWLVPYHDEEWGVAVHDDRHHFGHLVLEGAQAGLSWLTVLKRRDAYRAAFCDFDIEAVARFGAADLDRLLADPGLIRNRLKLRSVITNAAAVAEVAAEVGSFDAYLWGFVDGQPVVNRWRSIDQVPATTPLSEALSKDLRRRGFAFVGPTVCYSHLQAAGLVVDHLVGCYRYAELAGGAR